MKNFVLTVNLLGLLLSITTTAYGRDLNRSTLHTKKAPVKTNISQDSWLKLIQASSGQTRDQAVVHAANAGHFPEFLKHLKPVHFTDGKNRITIFVTPDYFAIGTKDRFVRIATGMREASAIAKQFNASLPTAKMVDAIYKQADKRLTPKHYKPDHTMVSSSKIFQHNNGIEGHLRANDHGRLIAGHKKDIVISKKLLGRSDRIAIYGWHRANYKPIQPLSFWHSHDYVDYSHGIRLVSRKVFLNGKPADLADVLKHPRLSKLLSDEGPFDLNRVLDQNARPNLSVAH